MDHPDAEPFERLALDIHRWQATQDPVLASLVEGSVTSWQQIPAVPVALFKDLPVGTVKPGTEAARFHTSGTTGGGRGTHRLRSTALYDHGALTWARACVPESPQDVAALLLDPADNPESSLSHMVALFGTCTWHLGPNGVDGESFNARVADATAPLYVAATAFALAELLEDHAPAALPAGSVLMVTGGFKGRHHRLDGEALYTAARQRMSPHRLVTEYGMTELSSQLWGSPTSAYRPPPWLRVVAVEPATGRPLPVGTRGQLRFYDLANLDGTLGVETLDEGVVHADGTLSLLGRLVGAPARGCSLTVEEAWALRENG
jgi:hypothetical protein